MSASRNLTGMEGTHTSGPQDVAIEVRPQTVVIVGNSGSGKSATARGSFVEPLLRMHRRVCIWDPTGIWWGLRFSARGGEGYPVGIAGGLHGDIELKAEDGVALADYIGGSGHSNIIDVSEMTIGERHEFATDFFAQLYKANRTPLHLIIDEADETAPQNPLPETRRMLHHVDRIVRRGRVRGFRPMMITQRPSVLHKNVMSQATVLVAMNLLGSQDRDAVLQWIKGQGDLAAGREVLDTLARLQTGEGWIWAPKQGILNRGRFPMFDTFDSSRTPKDDEPAVEPPGPLPFQNDAAIIELRAGMAYRDAGDVPELPPSNKALAKQLEETEQRGFRRGLNQGIEQGNRIATSTLEGLLSGILKRGMELIDDIRAVSTKIAQAGQPIVTVHVDPGASQETHKALGEVARAVIKHAADKDTPGGVRLRQATELNGSAAALLGAAASVEHATTWQHLAILATMKVGNGNFNVGRKHLVDHGLVSQNGSLVEITAAGLKIAGGKRPPIKRKEIIAAWVEKLRTPGGRMLRAIAGPNERGGHFLISEISTAVGAKPGNGNWNVGMKALRQSGLIERDGDRYCLSAIVRDHR